MRTMLHRLMRRMLRRLMHWMLHRLMRQMLRRLMHWMLRRLMRPSLARRAGVVRAALRPPAFLQPPVGLSALPTHKKRGRPRTDHAIRLERARQPGTCLHTASGMPIYLVSIATGRSARRSTILQIAAICGASLVR